MQFVLVNSIFQKFGVALRFYCDKLDDWIQKMKNLSLILLLALLVSLGDAQMTFDLTSASYQSVSGFWDLAIPVSGGVNPLTYSYQYLPATWLQNGNNIQIPTAATFLGGTWAVKVIVSDALGNQLQRSLLIKISGGAIYIGDYPYSQIFTLSASGAATVSPSSSTLLTTSTTTSSSSGSVSTSTVNNANAFGNPSSTAGVITLEASGRGSNTALPNNSQLDVIINSGDSVTITQTVQRVIASTLSCTQKSGYLFDFLGRIASYIAIKQAEAQQLNNIITSSQRQIAQLDAQISNYMTSIANLNIPTLQGQLSTLLANLQNAYNLYNSGNIDLTPFNLNISANLESIGKLSNTLTTTTAQLKADNQSLNNTETLIASLEQQLATARANRGTLQARILQQSQVVSDTQKNIDFLNADNVKLNNQINAINGNKHILQNKYQSLEAHAQHLKNTIASYQAQQTQYNSQISVLRTQLQQAILNTHPTALNALQQTISNLNLTIPALKQQIDYVKFNCNGAVNYTVSTLHGTITYTFASSVFSTYVTNEFGKENTNAAQALLGPISKATLTPLTIFAPSWVNQFGASFINDLNNINSNLNPNSNSGSGSSITTFTSSESIPYLFASDFSCSSTKPLTSGQGIVKSIIANYVTLSVIGGATVTAMGGATVTAMGGARVTAILGACSNILLLNQSQPKVGNNVYWRGLSIGAGTYQVYSALFF